MRQRPDHMLPSAPETLIILPARENFSSESAGAISLVVQRFCSDMSRSVVMGAPRTVTFPGTEYEPVRGLVGMILAIRRRRPDVIEVHQQPRLAILLAMLFWRTRVSLFLHNDPLTMRGLRSRFERRLALRRLHLVVCVSDYLKARFMTGLRGAEPAVLHNPLTLSELPPPAAQRRKSVLFVGRITIDKAPDVFIAACDSALPNMPGWSAWMIGGDRFGPDSPETNYVMQIRAQAVAAGVKFEGPLPHADVLAAMAEAAIIVVPSRWAEPFGLTALEALASGAVLITTGQGGLREVAGDAAVYVPPDDVPELARALLDLSAEPQKLAALSAAGLERAKLFDTPLIAARLEALRAARFGRRDRANQGGHRQTR